MLIDSILVIGWVCTVLYFHKLYESGRFVDLTYDG